MLRLDLHRRPQISNARGKTVLVLTIMASLFIAGCSSVPGSPQMPAPQPQRESSAAPESSAVPQLRKYSQAELAQRPCDALDERDLAALGITGAGEEESSENGKSCRWLFNGQNVSLNLDLPLSYAQTMVKNGRVTQVPVGQHNAVQAEFQRICFIFVAVHETDHLVGTTTIPEPGVPQEGVCPAGAAVAAAALTHIQ